MVAHIDQATLPVHGMEHGRRVMIYGPITLFTLFQDALGGFPLDNLMNGLSIEEEYQRTEKKAEQDNDGTRGLEQRI